VSCQTQAEAQMEIDREADVKDIHFEYYQSGIRCDQQGTLPGDIAFLSQHLSIHFTVEGTATRLDRPSTTRLLAIGAPG